MTTGKMMLSLISRLRLVEAGTWDKCKGVQLSHVAEEGDLARSWADRLTRRRLPNDESEALRTTYPSNPFQIQQGIRASLPCRIDGPRNDEAPSI